jgi:ATP-dependent Zn protease
VTIVSRGQALGYTLNLPMEERYLHTKEELVDMMKVFLAGRAAEQSSSTALRTVPPTTSRRRRASRGRWSSSTAWARRCPSRTMRADNYALSEETKRLRDAEQARLTDEAYEEAIRLLTKYRSHLDRLASALLEQETLNREELDVMFRGHHARVERLRDHRHSPARCPRAPVASTP